MSSLRRCGSAVALSFLLAGAAGCGASSPAQAPHPFNYMPARAQVALEAAVRPSGAVGDSARAALRTLGVSAETVTQLDGALATPGASGVDYPNQVKPWLGERAGLFVDSGGAREQQLLEQLLDDVLGGAKVGGYPFAAGASGAVVLDAGDRGKARSFLRQRAAAAGARVEGDSGAWLAGTRGGLAFGAGGPIVAIGSAVAVREVLATVHGSPSLAASDEYRTLSTHAPGGSLVRAFAAPEAAADLPASMRGAAELVAGPGATLISMVPQGSTISLDAESTPSAGAAAGTQAREAFTSLPGEAWLAAGLGGGPSTLAGAARALASLSGPASDSGAGSLLGELDSPLNVLAAQKGAWAGPVGLFAAGNGLLELRAAAILRATTAASAASALERLSSALGVHAAPAHVSGAAKAVAIHLHELPLELVAATGPSADGEPEVVVGVGAPSVELALRPPQTMESSPAAQAARQTLGGLAPTLVTDVPTVLGTVETLQAAGEPLLKGATPYLQRITTIDAGIGSAAPGVSRWRLVATLHH